MAKLLERLTQKEIKKIFNADLEPGRYAISFEDNKVSLTKANRKTSRETHNCIMVIENPRSIDYNSLANIAFDWGKWDSYQNQSNDSLSLSGIQQAINDLAQRASRQVEQQMYMSPVQYDSYRGLQSYITEQERGLMNQQAAQAAVQSALTGVWNYEVPVTGNYIISGIDTEQQVVTLTGVNDGSTD